MTELSKKEKELVELEKGFLKANIKEPCKSCQIVDGI